MEKKRAGLLLWCLASVPLSPEKYPCSCDKTLFKRYFQSLSEQPPVLFSPHRHVKCWVKVEPHRHVKCWVKVEPCLWTKATLRANTGETRWLREAQRLGDVSIFPVLLGKKGVCHPERVSGTAAETESRWEKEDIHPCLLWCITSIFSRGET